MSGSVARLDELAPEDVRAWRDLHEPRTTPASPFTTYEFCRSVHRVRGDVFVARPGAGATSAFFPFQRARLPGVGEKVGGHMSDYFGIVGGLQQSWSEQELLRCADLSVFSFDHLPLEQRMLPLDRGEISLGIRVPIPDFDTYLAQLRASDRKFVNEVERMTRQLGEKCGEIRFEWQAAAGRAELNRLITEKRSQYRKSGVKDALHPEWTRKLLFGLLEAGGGNCEAVLSTLFAGDTWIASNLALRHGETLHIWFPTFNHDYRRFGPGHMLFFRIFENGFARGVRLFDFGGGDAAYKKKYAGEEYPLFRGILRRGDMMSVSHRAVQSLAWRAQPLLQWASRLRPFKRGMAL